jgi:hypothetical protein
MLWKKSVQSFVLYPYLLARYGRKEERTTDMKTAAGRSKIGFFLSDEIIEKFRLLVQQKYKSYEKGLLSHECELALRHWVALHTNTQTEDIVTPNPTPRVALVFARVKKYLLDNFYFELRPGQQIPLAHLEKAIMEVRGTDPRTVRKWLQTFRRMGLAKPITPYVWEIL